MRDKAIKFISSTVTPMGGKTKNWFEQKLRQRYKKSHSQKFKQRIQRLLFFFSAIVVVCLIRLAYFVDAPFLKNTIWEFSIIYLLLGLFAMVVYFVFKHIQFLNEDLENERSSNSELEFSNQKLTDEKKELISKHTNEVESMVKAEEERMDEFGETIIQKTQNKLEEFKVATIEKVEKEILSNVFSASSEKFNESKEMSRAELLQKEREQKAELKRREDKIEVNEKITSFIQQSFTWKDKMNNEIFETNKRIGELGLRLSEELPKIKQSIYEIKTWAEGNFTQMKFWVKEEVLRIDKNHIQVVNQFEAFNIQYEGDKREIKQQFDGVNLYIEKVAMTAHERLLAFSQQTQNEFFRLDRRIDNSDRLFGDIQHNLEKGLLYAKMEREQMKSENKGLFRTIQHNLEKGLLNSKMEREQIRQESDKKIFILNTKLDKKLDEFAFKHQISIRDLTHLMEIKDYQLKDLIDKNHNQIKSEITDIKANNKIQLNNLDTKYMVQLKDLETVHMKHLYEQDQKIMTVVNKIESFHNDISAVGVRMDKLNVQFQGMGVANDQVRQEAKNIVTSLNLRMESIDNALQMTRETSKLVEGRIQNSVRGDLLKLKEITINQESKAKELASAERGLRLMFNDYHNQATEKELNLKSIEQNLNNLHREIALERKNIQVDSRLQNGELVMSEKLANLEHQRDRAERAYNDINKEAQMYKDMAHYYKKEGGRGY